MATIAEDQLLSEPLAQQHGGLQHFDNSATPRKDRKGNANEERSGNSNSGSNGNPGPPGDEDISGKHTNLSNEEDSDSASDPGSDPNSETENETVVCPNCVRLAASVVRFYRTKNDFLQSSDSECCTQNIEQCIRLLQQTQHPLTLKSDSLPDPYVKATSTLYHKVTGCSACVELATSVAQFHGTKEDLDFQDCEGCKSVIPRSSIVLLQQTGHLVTLRSCHRAKVKRTGARWRKIRDCHLRKMNKQLSLADPFHHKFPLGRIFEEEPGIQGCLSRPRPSKPLLSALNESGTAQGVWLVRKATYRGNMLNITAEDMVTQGDDPSWFFAHLWVCECLLQTSVSPVGDVDLVLGHLQGLLDEIFISDTTLAERIWQRDAQALECVMFWRSMQRQLLRASIAAPEGR